MSYKNIIGLVPTMQSINLVSENISTLKKPKKDGSGQGIRANRGRGGCSTTELVGLGMKNIVGTNLIKIESGLIAGL